MASSSTTPRQKMINVMYLILTAMLALNVSAEVLRAFFLVEKSIEKSGNNIDKKNQEIMFAFSKQMDARPERTREWYDKAKTAEKISADFVLYLDRLKQELIEQTGGRVKSESGVEEELLGKENTEKHANTLIKNGKGAELKLKINETRNKLLALLPPGEGQQIISDLQAVDNGTQSWASFHFEQSPLAAVITMMTKIQNDCRNTEHDVIHQLYKKVSNSTITVNQLQATIVPKANFVMSGDAYEAEIFLTAYDSKQANEVTINGQKYTAENGKVRYKVPAGTTGNFPVNGEIFVKEEDSLRRYPFTASYTVYEGAAMVSADKMNVMYIGVDNPISVSVPGVPPDRVKATISSGELIHTSATGYLAKVRARGTATVSVQARDDYGNWKSMGSFEYKVRSMPKPEMKMGTLVAGTYAKNAIIAQNTLVAAMDPNFFFSGVNFSVLSYDVKVIDARNGLRQFSVNGAAITTDLKTAIAALGRSGTIIFDNVRVSGPDGEKIASFTIGVR